jgi:hypothetical protein
MVGVKAMEESDDFARKEVKVYEDSHVSTDSEVTAIHQTRLHARVRKYNVP